MVGMEVDSEGEDEEAGSEADEASEEGEEGMCADDEAGSGADDEERWDEDYEDRQHEKGMRHGKESMPYGTSVCLRVLFSLPQSLLEADEARPSVSVCDCAVITGLRDLHGVGQDRKVAACRIGRDPAIAGGSLTHEHLTILVDH
jgi:hypothetical protein